MYIQVWFIKTYIQTFYMCLHVFTCVCSSRSPQGLCEELGLMPFTKLDYSNIKLAINNISKTI